MPVGRGHVAASADGGMAPAPVDGQADLPVAASPSTDAPSSVAAPFPQADFEDLDLETLEALEAAAIEAAAAKAAAAKAVPAKAVPAKAVPAYIANDSRAQELAQEAQELLAKRAKGYKRQTTKPKRFMASSDPKSDSYNLGES